MASTIACGHRLCQPVRRGTLLRRKIQLTTRLSPEDCAARISAATDREPPTYPPPANWENSKPVIGKATPKRIQLRKRIHGRNPLQNCLRAKLRLEQVCTVISGKIGIHPVLPIILFVWGGAMFLVLTMGVSGTPEISFLEMVLGALFVLLFGGVSIICLGSLVLLYRHLTKDETKYLTDFLTRTVDGQITRQS